MPVDVELVDHPLVADSLRRIRDEETPDALFRVNLQRIGTLLIAAATTHLPTEDVEVETPLTTAPAKRLAVRPVIVPILRAGLGFVHAAQELMPVSDVGFVGVSRDEETFQPHAYVNKLPESLAGRPVLVLDPMLATGGSAIGAIQAIQEAGGHRTRLVCMVAAPEGIGELAAAHPHVDIYTPAVDRALNDKKYILPGLGDFGDRLYGTT
jgi:uracil phosphoribosyltransferase